MAVPRFPRRLKPKDTDLIALGDLLLTWFEGMSCNPELIPLTPPLTWCPENLWLMGISFWCFFCAFHVCIRELFVSCQGIHWFPTSKLMPDPVERYRHKETNAGSLSEVDRLGATNIIRLWIKEPTLKTHKFSGMFTSGCPSFCPQSWDSKSLF